MISYKEIREKIQNFPKYKGCKYEDRSPLINEGFSWTFNLSFGEPYLLKEYDSYSNFTHDYVCSAIQSVIRPNDIFDKIVKGIELWKYLGVFEMSDISGMICFKEAHDYKEIQEFQISSLIHLLESFGLDKKKIYPTYSVGGPIFAISDGKYKFDFNVPEDSASKELFIKYGIPEKNLIKDSTRNSFLCLHLNRKTPWGYRNEIHYNISSEEKPELLDIATFENLIWLPTFKPGIPEEAQNINGITKFQHSLHLSVIGVERFAMIVNGLNKIQEIDYLRNYFEKVFTVFSEFDEKDVIIVGELIRVLHRIFSDLKYYQLKLNKRQRQYKNKMIIALVDKLGGKFDPARVKPLLEIHAEVQPWHPELKEEIEDTLTEISRYLSLYYKKDLEKGELNQI